MGTELQEGDALIESYISFSLHKRAESKSRVARPCSSTSDIEMRLSWDYLLAAADSAEEMEEEGCQLLEAARHDDMVCVTELLASNPRYREKGAMDAVLRVVARCGHQSTAKKLIDFIKDYKHSSFKYKSPLQKPRHKNTMPLIVALEHGHKEVASHLIKDLPPNIVFTRNYSYYTIVDLAIKPGYKDLLEEMLQQAPWSSLSQPTRDRLMWSSIVHNAIEARDLGLLQILLEKMPILIDANSYKGKPLQYAAYKGYIEEVRYILDNFPGITNNCGHNGCFAIHSAVAGNHLDVVKEIVSRYPNTMDHVDRKGRNPLSLATQFGYLDQVCYFLDDFPNYAYKCDEDGSFPIHKAVTRGHVDIVKEFISRCPETMSQINGKGQSILHLVVERVKPDILSYLKTIPEIKQIYHLRDVNGNTFLDLVKKQMGNWGKTKENKENGKNSYEKKEQINLEGY